MKYIEMFYSTMACSVPKSYKFGLAPESFSLSSTITPDRIDVRDKLLNRQRRNRHYNRVDTLKMYQPLVKCEGRVDQITFHNDRVAILPWFGKVQ